MTHTDTDKAARNRELAHAFLKDSDSMGLGFIDLWMRPDFRSHAEGGTAPPLDLAGYRSLCEWFGKAFSQLRHEVHHTVAEGDLVALLTTMHVVHSGEFEGVAATGKTLAFPESIILRFQDGKVAEEWLVMDFASARRQLAG